MNKKDLKKFGWSSFLRGAVMGMLITYVCMR